MCVMFCDDLVTELVVRREAGREPCEEGGETKLREREEPRFRVAAAQVGNEKKREMAKRVFGLWRRGS